MKGATGSLDWTFKGMKTLVLENEKMKVSILLDKGSDIFQVIYKPLDIDVMWHSPKGYRNPTKRIQSITDQAEAFTDNYGGGWNDIFPNYGFASSNRGTKFGLHGESALLPWTCSAVNTTSEGVEAKLSYDCIRYPIHAEKTYRLDKEKPLLTIKEELTNVGDQPVELSWAQHIAFGEPFVDQNLQIEIPAVKARTHDYDMAHERIKRNMEFTWPNAPALNGSEMIDLSKIPARQERIQEDFPITELRSPEYALYNSGFDLGVEVRWNRETFPYLWYWLNWGTLNYPWFGRGRTLALEPTTTTSTGGIKDQIADGTAIVLQSLEKIRGELEMELFQRKM